jgi:hypothetical protein
MSVRADRRPGSPAAATPRGARGIVGGVRHAATVTGDDVFSAQRPFAVEVRPSDLVARLRRAEPPQDQAT